MLCLEQRATQTISLEMVHLYFPLQGQQLKQMAVVLRTKAHSIINAASVVYYSLYQINLKLTHWYTRHTVSINSDAQLNKCNLLFQSYQ